MLLDRCNKSDFLYEQRIRYHKKESSKLFADSVIFQKTPKVKNQKMKKIEEINFID
jgi:hypothetical protein